MAWSERLIAHLDRIETPLVFFMLDDFYPLEQMDLQSLENAAELMMRDPSIPVFYLNNYGGVHQSPVYPDYDIIDHDCHVRMKVQAAIWRKDLWYKYLRKHESAWQLESYGTIRAKRFKEDFYCYHDLSQVPYKRDQYKYGVIKGKWQTDTPDLFEKFGMECDFSKRGFVTEEDNETGKVYSLKQNMKHFYRPEYIRELICRTVSFVRSVV